MLTKTFKESFELFEIIFVNSCILGCNLQDKFWSSGLSYTMFGFFFHLKIAFSRLSKLKMVQSFENENMINENTCEVFMNNVMEEKYGIKPSLQTKNNQNPKKKKKKKKKKKIKKKKKK